MVLGLRRLAGRHPAALFSVEDQHTKLDGVLTTFAFFLGAILSASAGWLGMMVATDGNTRTTAACAGKEVKDSQGKVTGGTGSLNDGLRVAFKAGSVMGFVVVGLGLVGCAGCFCILAAHQGLGKTESLQILAGFGFGASSIALFARVAGGILHEGGGRRRGLSRQSRGRHRRGRPAQPGRDCGQRRRQRRRRRRHGRRPLRVLRRFHHRRGDAREAGQRDRAYLLAVGVRRRRGHDRRRWRFGTNEKGEGWNSNLGALMWALEKGTMLGRHPLLGPRGGLLPPAGRHVGRLHLRLDRPRLRHDHRQDHRIFHVVRLRAGEEHQSAGATGPATVTIQGLGVGMISCVPTIVVLVCAILGCAAIKGEYGVAIAAVGMLATLGITLATDAYGPVADNAGGIAEMDPSDSRGRARITDSLDALGNTTAATGKGFAIGSAVLTSFSLLAAFKEQAQLDVSLLAVTDPYVLSGMLFGAMLPYIFAALTMISVGKSAAEIIFVVRDEFHNRPDLVAQDGKTTTQGRHHHGAERRGPEPAAHGRHPRQQQVRDYLHEVEVREMIAPGRLRDPRAAVRRLLNGRQEMVPGRRLHAPRLGDDGGIGHRLGGLHGRRRHDVQRRRRVGQRQEVLREGRHEGFVLKNADGRWLIP